MNSLEDSISGENPVRIIDAVIGSIVTSNKER